MAEIINLNKTRKQRRLDEKRTRAQQNRRKYGRTRAVREAEERERESRVREIDGKRLEDSPVRDSFGADITFYHRDADEHDGESADSPAFPGDGKR